MRMRKPNNRPSLAAPIAGAGTMAAALADLDRRITGLGPKRVSVVRIQSNK